MEPTKTRSSSKKKSVAKDIVKKNQTAKTSDRKPSNGSKKVKLKKRKVRTKKKIVHKAPEPEKKIKLHEEHIDQEVTFALSIVPLLRLLDAETKIKAQNSINDILKNIKSGAFYNKQTVVVLGDKKPAANRPTGLNIANGSPPKIWSGLPANGNIQKPMTRPLENGPANLGNLIRSLDNNSNPVKHDRLSPKISRLSDEDSPISLSSSSGSSSSSSSSGSSSSSESSDSEDSASVPKGSESDDVIEVDPRD